MTRNDGRNADQLRPIQIATGFQKNPEGSVIYSSGDTRIMVAASVSERIPDFLVGSGSGWVTAEYAMHPRANPSRQSRDGRKGRVDGRSQEIQRLIGRSLRAAIDFEKLGERSIYVDCDVLDADGGTRTASICGGSVALAIALQHLKARGLIKQGVMHSLVAAISVGMVDGSPMLDLCYTEDSEAEVDLNVVGNERGEIIEVQGTAEDKPIKREHLDAMLDLAIQSFPKIIALQKEALQAANVNLDSIVA